MCLVLLAVLTICAAVLFFGILEEGEVQTKARNDEPKIETKTEIVFLQYASIPELVDQAEFSGKTVCSRKQSSGKWLCVTISDRAPKETRVVY